MVENPTCKYLGIWPEQIEDAGDVLDSACKQRGIDADEVWEWVEQEFNERFGISDYNHISNVIVGIIFDCLKEALNNKGFVCDYYINGTLDTSFYIDGEEVS